MALSRECSIQTVEVKLTCLTPFFIQITFTIIPIWSRHQLGMSTAIGRDAQRSERVDWLCWMSSLAFSESSCAAALSELQNHEKEAAAIFYGIRNCQWVLLSTGDFGFDRKCCPRWVPVAARLSTALASFPEAEHKTEKYTQ